MDTQPIADPLDVKMLVLAADQLRSEDPEARASAAEVLVRKLDELNYPLETLLPTAIVGPAPVGSKPSTKKPMGEKNWMTYIRFLLLSPILTDWDRDFLTNIQRNKTLTARQKQTLWRILHKVFPAGCGNWGKGS